MDGKLICFIEHQSSVNPNMPLRILIYAARTYERKTISNEKLMYSSKLIKIPTPEFYVLYNGTDKLENTQMKLSDAFDIETEYPALELKVNVININYNYLKDTGLEECKPLYEYSYLMEKIREYKGDITKAVDECIRNDVLTEYLTFYGSEVINMLYTEYDYELAKKVLAEETAQEAEARGRAEGKAEGRAEGKAEGKAEIFKQMLQNGFTAEKIISMFHLSKEETHLYFGDAQPV